MDLLLSIFAILGFLWAIECYIYVKELLEVLKDDNTRFP